MKNKMIKLVLILVFILFICLIAVSKTGYINKINYNNTIKTEEEKKEFERKILSGEEIEINNFFYDKNIKYNNDFSDLGLKLSDSIDLIYQKIINIFNKLFKFLLE